MQNSFDFITRRLFLRLMADPLGAVASSNLKGLASLDPAFFIAVAGKILALDQAGRSFSIMSSFFIIIVI